MSLNRSANPDVMATRLPTTMGLHRQRIDKQRCYLSGSTPLRCRRLTAAITSGRSRTSINRSRTRSLF